MLLILRQLFGDHWRALMRFPAARRAVAFGIALLLVMAVRPFLGAPPRGFGEWPSEARYAASCLVEGAIRVAFAAWLWHFSLPVEGFVPMKFRLAVRVVRGVLMIVCGGRGIALLLSGVGFLQQLPAPGVARVWSAAWGAVITPLAVGAAPICWHFASEWAQTSATYGRLIETGDGPHGGWAHPHQMQPHLRPLPKAPQ